METCNFPETQLSIADSLKYALGDGFWVMGVWVVGCGAGGWVWVVGCVDGMLVVGCGLLGVGGWAWIVAWGRRCMGVFPGSITQML